MADPQTGSFTPTIAFQQLSDFVTQDPKLKGELYSRRLMRSAQQHNAFALFTSNTDASGLVGNGVRSIFCRKTDLSKGGADKVNFNIMGPPGGPGAIGNQRLTDRTSAVLAKTFSATVAWHRDAVSFSKDDFEFLSAGGVLESTSINMLSEKMGLEEQNHMGMRLVKDATSYNTYRPGNRASVNDLLPEDTLSLNFVTEGKVKLSTIGGKPIAQKIGKTGYHINQFLTFGTDNQFLNLRNDDTFRTLLSTADTRGSENALFTGELMNVQNQSFFEFTSLDPSWDDYVGNFMTPKAFVGQAVSRTAPNVLPNPLNTISQYLKFFPGAPYNFDGDFTAAGTGPYYAWFINPDGSVAFAGYTSGFTNGANGVALTTILSTNTTGINDQTVGQVIARTSATTGGDGVWTPTTGESNLPAGFVYTDQIAVGAVMLPANAKGTVIGRSFIFGAMSGCFANGRIDMAMIEQKEDFGFITAKGYESIMGTCTTVDPLGRKAGYLLIECASPHQGLPTPEPTFFV